MFVQIIDEDHQGVERKMSWRKITYWL